MKYLISILLILFIQTGLYAGTDKYYTRNGQISFVSHTPIIDIQAKNDQVVSVINIKTGEIAFAVLMKSFKFKRALAEEHFNENYVNSDKYPKAKFKGKITNIDKISLDKNGKYNVTVEGKLTIKDKTNNVKAKGTITVKSGKITATSDLIIVPEDYNIEVPSIVRDKVAKEINITINMIYKPYNK